MWKKDEPTPAAPPRSEAPSRAESRRSTGDAPSSERAIIGPSITIKGEVSGDEDLLIQGQVEGSVELDLHSVTVGRDGRVKANITARVVTVEGNVEGDLLAEEQIILRSSARVMGDITAPRVVLEDGASFKGLVDMGERPDASRTSNAKAKGATGSARSSDADASKGTSESSASGGSSSSVRASSGKDAEGSEVLDKAAP
jgi:cytoskeletal protein CcmA (bactofilin family)